MLNLRKICETNGQDIRLVNIQLNFGFPNDKCKFSRIFNDSQINILPENSPKRNDLASLASLFNWILCLTKHIKMHFVSLQCQRQQSAFNWIFPPMKRKQYTKWNPIYDMCNVHLIHLRSLNTKGYIHSSV